MIKYEHTYLGRWKVEMAADSVGLQEFHAIGSFTCKQFQKWDKPSYVSFFVNSLPPELENKIITFEIETR